jgi:hypothetical protein
MFSNWYLQQILHPFTHPPHKTCDNFTSNHLFNFFFLHNSLANSHQKRFFQCCFLHLQFFAIFCYLGKFLVISSHNFSYNIFSSFSITFLKLQMLHNFLYIFYKDSLGSQHSRVRMMLDCKFEHLQFKSW